MERRIEKEEMKEDADIMNVHHAQYREMKSMKVIREFVIFFLAVLNGRAYQTRFKSEQPIFGALGMLLYFI